MNRYFKLFGIFFLLIIVVAFVSFAISFGYDEGTFHNQMMGKIATKIFMLFKFPFISLRIVPNKYFLLGMLFNIFLWSLFISTIFHFIRKFK